MKILFLTPWYPDEATKNHGIFVREQALALATEHEVVVISSKVDYNKFGLSSFLLNTGVYKNIKEYRLVISRSLPIYNQLNYFLISASVSIKIAREFKPDIIHGNIGYPGGFWAWWVSKRINKPFVITEHTFIYNNFRSIVHKKLTVFAMRHAARVITVSNKAASEIKKYASVEAVVVPNIVDTARFSIGSFPSGKVSIGFMGGLASAKHVKGLDTLLRALSKIKQTFAFTIAGDGAMIADYKKLATDLNIADRCKFIGYVPHDAVPALLHQFHFFVNTSRFETFGIALVEAMSAGLPVVCFDNGGPADFVTAENGMLVEDQNIEKLTTAIEWMLANYKTYDREKIRGSVADRFSIENFLKMMEGIYKEVIEIKSS